MPPVLGSLEPDKTGDPPNTPPRPACALAMSPSRPPRITNARSPPVTPVPPDGARGIIAGGWAVRGGNRSVSGPPQAPVRCSAQSLVTCRAAATSTSELLRTVGMAIEQRGGLRSFDDLARAARPLLRPQLVQKRRVHLRSGEFLSWRTRARSRCTVSGRPRCLPSPQAAILRSHAARELMMYACVSSR